MTSVIIFIVKFIPSAIINISIQECYVRGGSGWAEPNMQLMPSTFVHSLHHSIVINNLTIVISIRTTGITIMIEKHEQKQSNLVNSTSINTSLQTTPYLSKQRVPETNTRIQRTNKKQILYFEVLIPPHSGCCMPAPPSLPRLFCVWQLR